MTTYYINSNNSAPWVAATVYSVGDRCVCKPATQNYNGGQSRVFECTTGGTSHGTTEPSWNYSLDGTTNDNDVVWTTRYPTSWDNAHCFLSMMMIHPLAAAGDWILVHKTHAETIPTIPAGGKFPGIIGVYNNPLKIICVDKDNSDAIDSGAVITYGQANAVSGHTCMVNIRLSIAYNPSPYYGAAAGLILMGTIDNLTLLELTGAANFIPDASTYLPTVTIINGNVSLANAANYLTPGKFYWRGGRLIAPNGTTVLLKLSAAGTAKAHFEIADVDLSAIGAGTLISPASTLWAGEGVFSRCKLPSNLSAFCSAFDNYGYQGRMKFHHCSYDKKTYGFKEQAAEGTTEHETSIVRTGGATDGITPVSWKMVSSAAANELAFAVKSPSINVWNESTSAIALTIHGIIDSATDLQNDEVWLEVDYPADTTSGLGTLKTTQQIYSGIADLTASTETWADGTLTNPNKFKLAATFTPAQAGPITARVCVGKASTTIYICPKAVIS